MLINIGRGGDGGKYRRVVYLNNVFTSATLSCMGQRFGLIII